MIVNINTSQLALLGKVVKALVEANDPIEEVGTVDLDPTNENYFNEVVVLDPTNDNYFNNIHSELQMSGAAMMVTKGGHIILWISSEEELVDVIADYSVSLGKILQPALEYADQH